MCTVPELSSEGFTGNFQLSNTHLNFFQSECHSGDTPLSFTLAPLLSSSLCINSGF